MPDQNNERGYNPGTNDLPAGHEPGRRPPRRRPAASEEGQEASRQERRRRAEIELEQVEQAYLSERQQAAVQRGAQQPAPPSPVEPQTTVYPAAPVRSRPAGPQQRAPYDPYRAAPPQAESPVVPAYPRQEAPAPAPVSRPRRTQGGVQRPGVQPQTPPPSYPVSDQGSELVIDASESLDQTGQILVELPMESEYGGDRDILNDEDTSDDAASLAKGGRLQAKLSTKRRKKRVGKRRYGVAVGSVVLLLAAVGLFVLLWNGYNMISDIIADESPLIAYDDLVGPVVAVDPQPFENITAADPKIVLVASILAVESETMETGEYDDYTENVKKIPVGEVLTQATRLFGPKCDVRLQSVKGAGEDDSYEYDEGKQLIIAPLNSEFGTYMAYTESSRRKGDSVLLRVGYVSMANWEDGNVEGDGDQDNARVKKRPKYTVDKYMEYELKTDPQTGKQYVFAVRELEGAAVQPDGEAAIE